MKPRRGGRDLAVCPTCSKDFVNPVAWEPVEDHSWWMRLRCGECGAVREVAVANAEAARFDEALDRRADPIAQALHELDRERMTAEVETMVAALRSGLIGAADFEH